MRRYHHIGIPTTESKSGETHLKHLKLFVVSHQKSEFGVEWMRFEADAAVPDLVRRVAHVAFEVTDLSSELAGRESSFLRTAHPTVSAWRSSSRTARRSNCSNLQTPNIQPAYRTNWTSNAATRGFVSRSWTQVRLEEVSTDLVTTNALSSANVRERRSFAITPLPHRSSPPTQRHPTPGPQNRHPLMPKPHWRFLI
jgi:hypothetical protein